MITKIIFKYIPLFIQITTSYLLLTTLKFCVSKILILQEILIVTTTISTFLIAWQSLSNNKIPIEINRGYSTKYILKKYIISLFLILFILFFSFQFILSLGGASSFLVARLLKDKILLLFSIALLSLNFLFFSFNISLKKQSINSTLVSISNVLLILLIYLYKDQISLNLFLKFYIITQLVNLLINYLLIKNKFNSNLKEDFKPLDITGYLNIVLVFYFIFSSRFTPFFLSNYIIEETNNSLINYHYLLIFINIFLSAGINPILNFTYNNQTIAWNNNKKNRLFIFYEVFIESILLILLVLSIIGIIIIQLGIDLSDVSTLANMFLVLFFISLSAVFSKLFYIKNYVTIPTFIDFISTILFIIFLRYASKSLNTVSLIAIQNFFLILITIIFVYSYKDLKQVLRNSIRVIFIGSLIFIIFNLWNNLYLIATNGIIILIIAFLFLKNKKTKLGLKLYFNLHE